MTLKMKIKPKARGKSYAESRTYLDAHYAEVYLEPGFRRGYERGQAYRKHLAEKSS